jgi:hypothetical protein
MGKVTGFFRFWYDFIVGDDWRIAIGVVLALIVAWVVDQAGIPAWWVMPSGVALVLWMSLRRATVNNNR